MAQEREFSEPRTGAPSQVERELSEKLDLPEAEARAIVIQYFAMRDAAEREGIESLDLENRAIYEVRDEFVKNAPGFGKEQKEKLNEIEEQIQDHITAVLEGEKEVTVTKEDYQNRADWYRGLFDRADQISALGILILGPKKMMEYLSREFLKERRKKLQ